MTNIIQKSSLRSLLLFTLGAIGACLSFIHIVSFSFFGTGVGDTSLPVFNMLDQLANASSKFFSISPDTLYFLMLTAIIILSIVALIYNIIRNNLKKYSTWLLILNLFFSLPTLLLFFIAWGMNASS